MSPLEIVEQMELVAKKVLKNRSSNYVYVGAADILTLCAAYREAVEWRTMESAPRDAPFWGKIGDDAIWMYWDADFNEFISGCREMSMHNGWTFEDGSTNKKHSPHIHKPTHWRPLPSPPATKES